MALRENNIGASGNTWQPASALNGAALRRDSSISVVPSSSALEYRPVIIGRHDSQEISSLSRRRAELARLIRERAARGDHFKISMFADPAWDILLDVAFSAAEGRRVSVSGLCFAASVPTTTAHSWIVRLVRAGLLDRARDRKDKRRCWVTMTAKAETMMISYLDSLSAR
jgi:Winged helix DNA-binding domain